MTSGLTACFARAPITLPPRGEYLVVPADLATIYNFNPAFAAGYSGRARRSC